MTRRAFSPEVDTVFDALPEATGKCARALRDLVFEVADEIGVSTIEEPVKWGEPAYLPGRTGTTVRIAADRRGARCKIIVNCRTSLVEEWRRVFGDRLSYEGNRAIVVEPGRALDTEALAICIAGALTYHRRSPRGVHG